MSATNMSMKDFKGGGVMALRIAIAGLMLLASSLSYGNEWHDEADRCWNEALKFKKQHDYKQTIEYLKRAVAAERKNEEPRSEELIAQLTELGRVHDILGEHERSLHYYTLAMNASRTYENAEQEIASLNSIGETFGNLGRYEEALASHEQALATAVKKGYRDREMQARSSMAAAYRAQKKFDNALSEYEKALAVARETGSGANIAVITSNMGTLYFFKGNFDESLAHYSEALSIDRKSGNDRSLSIDLSNMGVVYAAQGRYGEALGYFEKALTIDKSGNDELRIASRLNRIGETYFNLGYNDRAIEFFTRSLEINTKLNNRINAAALHNSLGRVYDSMGRYDESMDHYLKGLTLNRNIELDESIQSRLGDIGMVYESRERYGEAVEYLNKALRRDIQNEKRGRIAHNLGNLGKVMISMKRYDRALEYFRQAEEINRELGDATGVAEDLKNSGIVCYYRKEYDEAAAHLSNALATLDAAYAAPGRAFFDMRAEVFRWLIAVHVTTGRPDTAYEINERYCEEKVNCATGDALCMKKGAVLGAEELRKNIGKNSAVVIFTNISWDDPQVIVIDAGGSVGYELDKAAMVNAVYNSRKNEIEAFMSHKKSDIMFNIDQRLRRDHYIIEFEKIVNYYRFLIGKKYIGIDEYETLKYLGKTMYSFLFKKIERRLADKEILVIQPDASLTFLPFETLAMTDGKFLVERFEISYAYSQSSRAGFKKRLYPAGRRSIVSLVDMKTDVPSSAKKIDSAMHFDHVISVIMNKIRNNEEIREAYGFFGSGGLVPSRQNAARPEDLKGVAPDAAVISGERATEPELKKMSASGFLSNYKIFLFNGSGIIVPETPLLSALAVTARTAGKMQGDGLLNIKELAGLAIRADLFHVAALRIPPTGFSRGEGIWSLCSSIREAGARGVSVSLWPVDDRANLEFRNRVFARMLNKNIPAGRAIAETKREFIQGATDREPGGSSRPGQGNYANPYFWGSWIYYGD